MATVPYQSFCDEDIAVNDEEISVSGSEGDPEPPASETHSIPTSRILEQRSREARINQYMDNDRWPRKIGIVHLVHGALLFLLGLAQVILVPFLENSKSNPVHFTRQNLYGIGIWTGFLLGVSGCVATRAALRHSNRALYAFILFVFLDILLMSAAILMIIAGYSSGWTTPSAYSDSGALFGIHVAVCCMIMLGYMMVLHAFMLYYEEVLCGQFQLCRKMVHCCFPCCCPRVAEQDELMDQRIVDRPPTERPPSLPV